MDSYPEDSFKDCFPEDENPENFFQVDGKAEDSEEVNCAWKCWRREILDRRRIKFILEMTNGILAMIIPNAVSLTDMKLTSILVVPRTFSTQEDTMYDHSWELAPLPMILRQGREKGAE